MKEYLTAKEVSEIFGVSVRTVERMSAEGTLPRPYKLTKRIKRYKWEEVEECLNQQTEEDDEDKADDTGLPEDT